MARQLRTKEEWVEMLRFGVEPREGEAVRIKRPWDETPLRGVVAGRGADGIIVAVRGDGERYIPRAFLSVRRAAGELPPDPDADPPDPPDEEEI